MRWHARAYDGILVVRGLRKLYPRGFQILNRIDLAIRRSGIFALLGPNGAGKTTLVSIICGIVKPGAGSIVVGGHHIVRDWRVIRSLTGLVPQEPNNDPFETAWNTMRFSPGMFGKAPDDACIAVLLRDLSLWDKRDSKMLILSGGMKRCVMIAEALSHGPKLPFLDEPTAGADAELRRDIWAMVRRQRESGVTVVPTTATFSLRGFIIGIWADDLEKLQVMPLIAITPLTFLCGSFLLHPRAATAVAEDDAVQSRGVPDLGVPLEFPWPGGYGRGHQSRHHAELPLGMLRCGTVDLQVRLQAESVKYGTIRGPAGRTHGEACRGG